MGTDQGCDVLDEGDVLVRRSEEEVLASWGQDAQQQRAEEDGIEGEIRGSRADV